MALPKVVERHAAEADAAQAAFMAQTTQSGEQVLNDPAQLHPAPDAPGNPVQQVATPPALPPEDWQQKYRTLQGIFAKQTGELQAQNKVYESQLAEFRQSLAEMKAKQDKPSEKAAADPKDVENFGADLVDMVQRYAERMFQSVADQFGGKAAELESRIAKLETTVTGVSAKTESTMEQQFFAALDGLVPNWTRINGDGRWLQWLAETDPVYGAPRQAALDHAQAALDVKRVSAIFQAFERQFPPTQAESLANQVAPSTAASPMSVTAQPARPILSSKFVEKFYNDKARGRYDSNPAEAARIEAEIDNAARESRIR